MSHRSLLRRTRPTTNGPVRRGPRRGDSARAFILEFGWTYPRVYDPTGAIRDGLGLIGQPVMLFYDASGALVDTWTGQLSQEAPVGRLESVLRD